MLVVYESIDASQKHLDCDESHQRRRRFRRLRNSMASLRRAFARAFSSPKNY